MIVLLNCVGDVFILIVIFWILNYGRWNYIFYLEFINNDWEIIIIGRIIIIVVIIKSV